MRFHFHHSLIVLRMCSVWRHVINVCWIEVGVLGWDVVSHVWLNVCRLISPWLFDIFRFISFDW